MNEVKQKHAIFLFGVIATFFLLGCLPEAQKIPKAKEDVKIVSGFLGKEQLFVPYAYVRNGMSNFNSGTISLQMMQPEFLPLLKTPDQMWQDGDRIKYVLLLLDEQRLVGRFSDHIQNRINFFDAFETVGSEYGLIHLTQPDGYVKDKLDVWVERNGSGNISYITCDDDNGVPFPQCSHEMQTDGVYVSIDYDKRNLPNWKKIQTGVVELILSFKSEENARGMLFRKYIDYQSKNIKGGE